MLNAQTLLLYYYILCSSLHIKMTMMRPMSSSSSSLLFNRLLLPQKVALRQGARTTSITTAANHHSTTKCFFSSSSPSLEPQKIGFVGLGNMGLPMAINLASNVDEVQIKAFDLNNDNMKKAEQAGILAASSLEDVAAFDPNVIFTMLPGCDAVHNVMPILLQNVSTPATTFVDCSTVSPTTSRHWHDKTAEAGHCMLDAPVSGGVKGATDGTLTFMVGSDSDTAFQKVEPLLHKMGSRVFTCGGPSSGSSVKLCNNLAIATQMIGICEAMNLGESLEVDPVVLANVFNMSTAHCWSSEVNNPHPKVAEALNQSAASKDYKGGFATKLMLKDLCLAVGAGQDKEVALPLGTASKELYRLAEKRGMGDKDFGIMLQFLRGK